MSIVKWILRNSTLDLQNLNNPIVYRVRQNYLVKLKEILGSVDDVWDSSHRTGAKQILKDITEKRIDAKYSGMYGRVVLRG
jgi:hypothetical protein